MESKKLTPKQRAALKTAKDYFQAGADSVKQGLELLEQNDLRDHFCAFMSLQTDNVNEAGEIEESVSVNRIIHGNNDELTGVLATTAADQETPWLINAYKNAARDAVVIKAFDTAADLRKFAGG